MIYLYGHTMRRWAAVIGGLTLTLAALAGCGGIASQQAAPTSIPTAQPQPTFTMGDPPTPTPGPFVCANPPGTSARYAYVGADGQLTVVNGCSYQEVHGRGGRLLTPQGFSPDGRWLLASEGVHDPEATPGVNLCDVLINTSTLAQTVTPICDMTFTADPTRNWFGYIGWSDNATYYDAGWGVGNDASVKIYRISVPSLHVTKVAAFSWVANLANRQTDSGIALRGGALYYAGYASSADHGHGWLRRYTLATGQDARIVALGVAGSGGCQVQVDNTPCAWTGPWDITPDGSRIAFHNPGPTQLPSDTGQEKGSPLYLAGRDGSSPVRLFPGSAVGSGFVMPLTSPDGRYITGWDASTVAFERLADGKVIAAPDKDMWPEWAAMPDEVVLYNEGAGDYYQHPVLFNIATGTALTLQVGSYHYVWAPAA